MRTEFRFAVFETTPPYALVVSATALALTEKIVAISSGVNARCRRVAGVSDADVLVRLAAGVEETRWLTKELRGVTGKSVRARRTRAVE